jgi:hypothetical protein
MLLHLVVSMVSVFYTILLTMFILRFMKELTLLLLRFTMGDGQ